jgi:hypothetical protein
MYTSHIAAGASSLLLLCVLCGCDIGRLRVYKLSLHLPESHHSTTLVKVEDEETLRCLIRSALNPKGFEEQPGKPGRWYKRGVWVELFRDPQDELILKVYAFGGKSEVRRSEQTERELVALLRQQPGVKLIPTTPTKLPAHQKSPTSELRSNAHNPAQ